MRSPPIPPMFRQPRADPSRSSQPLTEFDAQREILLQKVDQRELIVEAKRLRRELRDVRRRLDTVDEQLTPTVRSKLVDFIAKRERDRAVVAVILTVIGCGTLAGAGTGLVWLFSVIKDAQTVVQEKTSRAVADINQIVERNSQDAKDHLDNAKHALDTKTTEAVTDFNRIVDRNTKQAQDQLDQTKHALDAKLDKLVKDEVLNSDIYADARHQLERELGLKLANLTVLNVTGTLSGVRLMLEMERQRQFIPGTNPNKSLDIDDMLATADTLLRRYGSSLDIETLPPQRRIALLYLCTGLAERAKSGNELARLWYERAAQEDPNMPEPHVLFALQELPAFNYVGKNAKKPWGDHEDMRQVTLAELCRAIELFRHDGREMEARRLRIEYHRISQKFELARCEADAEIRQVRDYRDPKLLFARAFVYWDMSADEAKGSQSWSNAKEDMWNAYLCDRSAARPANNFIWFATHYNDEALTEAEPSPADRPRLLDCLDALLENPALRSSPSALNTVVETYILLKDPKNAETYENDVMTALERYRYSDPALFTRLNDRDAKLKAKIAALREEQKQPSPPTKN